MNLIILQILQIISIWEKWNNSKIEEYTREKIYIWCNININVTISYLLLEIAYKEKWSYDKIRFYKDKLSSIYNTQLYINRLDNLEQLFYVPMTNIGKFWKVQNFIIN